MPQPKRRHSHSRKNKRRSHHALNVENLAYCSHCKEPKLPHQVCPKCGYYDNRQTTRGLED